MTRRIPNVYPISSRLGFLGGFFVIAILGLLLAVPQSAAAATFTVNSTLDLPDLFPGDGSCGAAGALCTLRAAIMESNASSGPNTINLPAGTYTLTIGPFDDEFNFDGAHDESGDLDILNNNLTINGAGSATTIIDGGAIDRVFDVNNFTAFGPSVDVIFQNLTIRNGNAPLTSDGYQTPGGAIQFDGTDNNTGSAVGSLTITNCRITANTASGVGGGIEAIFGSLSVSGSEISSNTSTSASAGGIFYDAGSSAGLRNLSITGSSVFTNHANNALFGSGAGIWGGGNATKTATYNVITGNTAGTQGGGVFNSSGAITMNFNVIVGNTAGDASSTGFRNGTGTINLDNNWWGCNQGPSTSPCDRAAGPAGFGITQWLKLNHTATPNTILINQSTTLQADFYTNNVGAAIDSTDLVALNGRAVTFNNAAPLGTISGADPSISGGKANATFNAGSVGGNGSADATVDSATATASILISEPTDVTTNPTDQTACDGSSVSFTAAASGFPTPTVQWQVSSGGPFTDIPGATSTTLTFTATSAQNGNQYRAVFTNSGGTDTTTAATLTVNTAPTVTTSPTSQTVCEGTAATFTAAANGSPAPTVQWQVDSGSGFTDIPGATSTTLSFTATTAQNGNQYRAVFTNTCGSATTTAATLTVNANTTTSDPADQTVCQGADATFSTTAGGTGPFTYAWTLDGNAFGGNTSSITVPTGSLTVGNHTVTVTTTGACSTASQSATLTVNANTTTTDPPDRSVCQGSTTSFTTTASGTGPFSFVWKKGVTVLNNGDFGGRVTITNTATTSTLTITNVQAGDFGTYTVETTGACSTASQSASLTVSNTPPGIVLNGNNIVLWPPDHSYHTINVTDLVASASSCDGTVNLNSVVIDSVTSDEVENGSGDGNTLNDIVIGCDRKSVQLRSERNGSADGRVYTITFKVTDSFGNTTTATATVTVPKNQNTAAVNSGVHYAVSSATCP